MKLHSILRLTLIVALLVACGGTASQAAKNGDMYLAPHGGLFLFSFDEPEGSKLGSAKDLTFGASFGYFVHPKIAVEGEFGYGMGSDVSAEIQTGQGTAKFDSPTGSLLHVNGNAFLPFDTGSALVPFATAGLGMFHIGGNDAKEIKGTLDGQEATINTPETKGTTKFGLNFGGGLEFPAGSMSIRAQYGLFVVFTEGSSSTANRLTGAVVIPLGG